MNPFQDAPSFAKKERVVAFQVTDAHFVQPMNFPGLVLEAGTKRIFVTTSSSEHNRMKVARVGDFVVRNAVGEMDVLTQREFRAAFEKISDTFNAFAKTVLDSFRVLHQHVACPGVPHCSYCVMEHVMDVNNAEALREAIQRFKSQGGEPKRG